MLFRLARELGMTVGHIESEMSPEEFSEWIALYRTEAHEREQHEMARRAQAGAEQRMQRARGR